MKSLDELITEVEQGLDAIATHPSFVALLETELWDDPAIHLSDACEWLTNIRKAHENLENSTH